MKLTLFIRKSKNYIKQSKQIAEDLNKTNSNGVYWANQFDNIVNAEAIFKRQQRKFGTKQLDQ